MMKDTGYVIAEYNTGIYSDDRRYDTKEEAMEEFDTIPVEEAEFLAVMSVEDANKLNESYLFDKMYEDGEPCYEEEYINFNNLNKIDEIWDDVEESYQTKEDDVYEWEHR